MNPLCRGFWGGLKNLRRVGHRTEAEDEGVSSGCSNRYSDFHLAALQESQEEKTQDWKR